MDKIKITEIKKDIKIKVLNKEESSKLEKELESDSFPEVSSENNKNSFVPTMTQSEIVSQAEGEELVRPKKEEDTPLFSESARYDTSMPRMNMSEGRIKYESSSGPLERVDPSLVRSSNIPSQSQGVGFRNDELERLAGHQKDYSAPLDVVKENKVKSLRPWEV